MPDQYAIEIGYNVSVDNAVIQHNHRFRVELADPNTPPNIGELPANITLATRGAGGAGGTVAFDLGLQAYLTAFCNMFGTNMSVTNASLTRYPFGLNGAGIYVSPVFLGDASVVYPVEGTGGFDSQPASQLIISCFDDRGRVSKFNYIEVSASSNLQLSPSAVPPIFDQIATYFSSGDCIARGSDNSIITAVKQFNFGQNEATWRQRFRP